MTASARDSPWIRVSSPGTNRRQNVREASGFSRAPFWSASWLMGAASQRRRRQADTELEHGDHRQGGLGPLIATAAIAAQAIASAAGPLVEERDLRIVVAEEPRHAHLHSSKPATVTCDCRGAHARIGERGHFDRLLVETRPGLTDPSLRPARPTSARLGSRRSAATRAYAARPAGSGPRPSRQPATMTASAIAAFA